MSRKISPATVKALVAAILEGGAAIHRVTLHLDPDRLVIDTQPSAEQASGFDEVEFGDGKP